MSVLLDEKSRVMVQGITGKEGTFHTRKCVEYAKECGTASGSIVAGVTPGKGGSDMDGIPVFNSVADAVAAERVDVSLIFVPPPFAADAILEAADAGIGLIVTITEGIPALDMLRVSEYLKKTGARMIGPNCPGVISPGKAKAGIMPGQIHAPGAIGVVSRSGTLTYEAVSQLTRLNLGQSTCIGVGGDPIIGTTFVDALELFEKDADTKGIVLIGEIGGTAEEEAAAYVRKHVSKPVTAFIAGRTAPAGRRMGHAGAIISGGKGGAADKIAALEDAGIRVAKLPSAIGQTMREALAR